MRLHLAHALAGMLPMLLAASAAVAQTPPLWQLSGFATVGALIPNEGDLWFFRSGVNAPGPQRVDLGTDSLAGVQASVHWGNASDFTVQWMVRETPRGNHDPRLSWAFWRYAPNSALTLRVGRVRVPFFMFSDSLYVNYANPWIRPPQEVYGLNPFSDIDGADLLLRIPLDGADLELRPYFGHSRIDLADDGRARLRNARGFTVSLIEDKLSVFLGHGQGRLKIRWGDIGYRTLVANLALAGGELAALPAELSGEHGRASFSAAGLHWDDGQWLTIAEIVRRRADRYVNSARAWHLTVGRRVGAFTPFFTLARQSEERPLARAEIADPQLAAGFDAYLASRRGTQHSLTVGVRWDFARNAALKTEFSRIRIGHNAWGNFFPSGQDMPGGRTVHLVGVSLDLVF
ncbi:MAG TPA: hypothetical protein PKM39_00600 [Pseudothauera hydrothermalis]|jgi:hypothetical protein|uniref:hypothetical protein n=1 Tax=Pseudothauera hydrothermalis TaxID=2184083 RepID=UPI000E09A299|nr:hypothetical protein [Pseudothauera hydrothermalis]HNQ75111.1 hypothetical protein [Pseudothauera hydrothermalis]